MAVANIERDSHGSGYHGSAIYVAAVTEGT